MGTPDNDGGNRGGKPKDLSERETSGREGSGTVGSVRAPGMVDERDKKDAGRNRPTEDVVVGEDVLVDQEETVAMSNLFEHQKDGVKFLRKHKRAILADEMGLGKTRQAIVAADEDTKDLTGIRVVICPASLKINWKREIEEVSEQPVQIIESGPERDILPVGWVVINYDMLGKYKDQLMELKKNGYILAAIPDEAHYIKGAKTIRAKIALELMKGLERVYILTGTPIMNRPAELYNMLVAIDHPLGRYGKKTFFFKRYCGREMRVIVKKDGRVIRFWDDSGATNLPELRALIKDYILRRTKNEVLDLPEKIISVEMVELNREWKKVYDEAWDTYLAWVEQNPEGKDVENIMSAQGLIELLKLKQVCSQAKIDRIVSDVKNAVDQDNKVIIFSQFTDTINMLKERFQEESIPSVSLTGQDDMNARQASVDSFQNDEATKIFIANIKAGGVGLNLTAASQVIFADMEWSPALHEQATDRAHRIGQTGTVNAYYYVVSDTIEEDIVEILQQKLQTIQAIVEGREDYEEGSLGAQFVGRLKERIMGTNTLG